MNYTPMAPVFHEHKLKQPDETRRVRLARRLGVGAVTAVAVLIGCGSWSQSRRSADAAAVLEAQRSAVPAVRTLTAEETEGPRSIELPGNIAAFDNATLFARATGYIAIRNVDIGSKVHQGDVLAKIAAPDLDQQLDQAKAQLVQLKASVEQAEANADLGRVTNERTSRLVVQGWNSQQLGDQTRLTYAAQMAAVGVARANVVAQQAAVNRLTELTSFEEIKAPFDGVITGRFIDVGSLVTADVSSGTPLFSIARTDVLRVQVYVPQAAYFGIHDGDHAAVTVPELPGRMFDGRVSRNARALAAGTRTLLTEVDVDNKDGTLTAGLYCTVHLNVPRPAPVVVIPSQAVIFNKNGLSAAIVSDGKVELRKLDLEVDNGTDVEVRTGLNPGDRVIVSPPANLANGMQARTL